MMLRGYKNIQKLNPKTVKKCKDGYKLTFTMNDTALTLDPKALTIPNDPWQVSGEIHEDYFEWINEFEATRENAFVKGDFEKEVYCSSLKDLDDFLSTHKVEDWDYGDI